MQIYNKVTKRDNSLKTAIKNGLLTDRENFKLDFFINKATKRKITQKTAIKLLKKNKDIIIPDNFVYNTITKRINKQPKKTPKGTKIINQKIIKPVKISPDQIKKLAEVKKWRQSLRNSRKVNNDTGIITQNSYFIDHPKSFSELDDYIETPYYKFFLSYISKSLYDFHKIIKDSDRLTFKLKILYLLTQPSLEGEFGEKFITTPKYITTTSTNLTGNITRQNIDTAKDIAINDFIKGHPSVGLNAVVVGYFYTPLSDKQKFKLSPYIENLKAYHPCSSPSYHKLTEISTTFNKICIYETYYYMYKCKDPKAWLKIKKKNEFLTKELSKESHELQREIREGNLINSLILLSKKENKIMLVSFFDSSIIIKVDHDDVTEHADKEAFNNESTFFYYKAHVAPHTINTKIKQKEENENGDELKNKYCLVPQILEKQEDENPKFFTWDIESYGETQTPYVVCTYSDKEEWQNYFYGADCIDQFVNWMFEISTPKNTSKTRPKNKIPDIFAYAHNGSKYDNLFVYKHIYNKNNSMFGIMGSTSIKYLSFHNIKMIDTNLLYPSSLAGLGKKFLGPYGVHKLTFPYDFVNSDNYDSYKGSVPAKKYWNSEDDKIKYIYSRVLLELKTNEKPTFKFDMVEYSKEYCMIDCKLLYDIMTIHHKKCQGSITYGYKNQYNNVMLELKTGQTSESAIIKRDYNINGSMTIANQCVKIFRQCFLKDVLYNSPTSIMPHERDAYKGGRTEVFKQNFESKGPDDKLYYFDINSSYPASMLREMPTNYTQTITSINETVDKDYKFIDTNNYLVRVKFPSSVLIPNLMYRTKKDKRIISVSDVPKTYHWGCELNHALKLGAEIYIYEMDRYTTSPIFKDYVEYYYAERLENKQDPFLNQFYKLMLNNLYGVFAMKPFYNDKIIKTSAELNELYQKYKVQDWNLIDDDLIKVSYADEKYGLNIGSMVRLSSYITALSRCNLAEFMHDVGHENVYYADTDSVFTSKIPSSKFLDNKILGKWKKETKGDIIKAEFICPKAYSYETDSVKDGKDQFVIHGKGIPQMLLNYSDYDKISQTTPLKKTIGKMFFRSLNGVTIKPQVRTMKAIYNKRIWNGKNSYPYNNVDDFENNLKYNPLENMKKVFDQLLK